MFDEIVTALGVVPSVIILALVALVAFYLLSEVSEKALAPALETLSERSGLPHDVACTVVVAFGSSAGEIAVNSAAAYHGQHSGLIISTGALIGSSLISFTIIPAVCTLVSPARRLHLHFIPLARDIVFFCISLYLVVQFSLDENIDLEESLILLGVFVVYFSLLFGLVQCYGSAAIEKGERVDGDEESTGLRISIPVQRDRIGLYGTMESGSRRNLAESSKSEEEQVIDTFSILRPLKQLCPPFGRTQKEVSEHYVWYILLSLVYISVLSEVCLLLALSVSRIAGLSGHFAGLVLVAFAAQVDDFATAIATAKQGRGPGSISNSLGSQVIDLTIGFGLPFLLFNLQRGYTVPVIRQESTAFLIFVAVAFFAALAAAGRLTFRWYHALLLCMVYVGVIYQFYDLTRIEPMDLDDDWH